MRDHSSGCRLSTLVAVLTALFGLRIVASASPQVVSLIETNASWRLFKGTAEPTPGDRAAWRAPGFLDAGWTEAPAPFGYGEPAFFSGAGTELPDMQNAYATIYLRRKFQVAAPAVFESLELKAVCDDGFVAWINGKQVASLNPPAGEPLFGSLAGANAAEPVVPTPYALPAAVAALVPGENVLAVQVFNTSLGSSDLVFDASLTGTHRPSESPIVIHVDPPPGPLADLNRITVTFSEAVRGVSADDFLVNGVSARRVEGTGATYTFHFEPPPFGPVEIRWGTLHAIEDFETPPRRFEITAPGSVWGYERIDPFGPTLVERRPPPSNPVSRLDQVLVSFDKAVIGVDAADLLRNGVAATNVVGIGAGPYRFDFAGPVAGTVAMSFAADHGIASDALESHPFAGTRWSYTVDPTLETPQLRITEFMAENLTTYRDEDQDPEDWIEIFNPTAATVNLEGWSLSNDDDDPGLWVFPSVRLPPGGFLVVHASAKDRRAATGTARLHTNFKLNPNGGYLGLFGPELPARVVSEIRYPEQGANHAYARENNGGEWRYFVAGSPGTANGVSGIRSVVEDVVFSVPRGFFQGAIRLTLSCPTPGASIRYTTNGSPPTAVDGILYTNGISIAASRVIRAAAFLEQALPSRVGTHTYILNPTGTRLRVPTLSLVTATNNLYGRTGIMEVSPRNTNKRGAAWERPVSVEWIRPEDNDGFQVDCGLRIQGGDYVRGQYNYRSTELPFSKYSFRLYFRGEYGRGRLNYPLFPETTQTSFDTIVLRAGMNDVSNPFLTDEFVRSLVRDTGQPSPSGTFVHLFLNGVYKGYYNPCERIDVDFLRAYHGGGEKWDVMAQAGEVREGDATAFNSLRTLASTRDLTQPTNYRDVASRLDLTNFVDYLLPLIYVDNDDWPHNNWRAARERIAGAPYRMYCWDAEWAFGLVNGHAPTWDTIRNQLSSTSPPWGGADIQRIFIGLKKAPEFRQFFADRAHRHLFNGGALTDDRLRARYAGLTNRLNGIVSGLNNRIGATWIPQRRRNVLLHLERSGLLASSNAPAFQRFGGTVPEGFLLTITNLAGPIYFTTNGVDPRVAFTGAVAPVARQYTGPIAIRHPLLLRARSLVDTNWSAVTEAVFEVNRLGVPLAITEIMYNPPGGEAFEFLELRNQGAVPLDVSGYSFGGVTFRFPTPTPPMPAGARWVIANGARPTEFAARYPGTTVSGWFDGSLNNAGERIEIVSPAGDLIVAVEYGDDPPWPVEADGSGASLEFVDPSGDPSDPAAWHAGDSNGGSPGRAPEPSPVPVVRLSEVAAVLAPGSDWIELQNSGATAVRLDGWGLSDNEDPRRFTFPAGTTLAAGSRLRIECGTNTTASSSGWRTGFSLSHRGETVALYDARRLRVDAVTFGTIPPGYSLGRVGADSAWGLCEPTPLAPNEAATLAPLEDLVVNEWMANPVAGDDDWIEVHNLSPTSPQALRGVYVTTSNTVARIHGHMFVAPGGFAVLRADGNPGPDHLAAKLPAQAGAIALSTPQGAEFHRVTYRLPMEGLPVGAEGISIGRLPDGTGPTVAFPGTPSPGAPNHRLPAAGPRFHEFMAANQNAVPHPSGRYADWIELHNPGATTYDLGGARLTIEPGFSEGWTFPPGSRIGANGYLLVWCDSGIPPTTEASSTPSLGHGLPAEGATLRLRDSRGQALDAVSYGAQLPDRSAGRSPFGTWTLLSTPTPANPNAAPALLGGTGGVRINEWLAGSDSGSDWIEVHNPETLPIDLGGHFLTDDPSIAGLVRFQIAPLTFVAPQGHLAWQADDGAEHLPFRLDARGETLRLYAANRALIDSVSFDSQAAGVASGRFPDGAEVIQAFPGSASPGAANWVAHPDLVISEVLAHTDPPLEDAIEFHNVSPRPLALDGWWVSNATGDLERYRIPPGIVLAPGGRWVLYERDFGRAPAPRPFTLNSAHGDEVWITETLPSGEPTGLRAHVTMEASANGVSWGRHPTSVGWDFAPLSRRTFGNDLPRSVEEFRRGNGLSNAYPLVGPVVVSEIHYRPFRADPEGPVELPDDEYVEIHNDGSQAMPLFDTNAKTNTWRLRGGIRFDFPTDVILDPGAYALVVGWDPASASAAEFRARRGVPADVRLLGPFEGRLSDQGEEIRLERPDRPQTAPAEDAGFVPYLLVERVAYRPEAPWPVGDESTETSLQRRRSVDYANDPAHWMAGRPSPGRASQPPLADRDFDGMPNDWETLHGFDPDSDQDAALDADGDGASNVSEYLAGTHPRDAASVLTLGLAVQPSAGLVVRFQAMAHRSYSILRRDDPAAGSWRRILDVPAEAADRAASIPLGSPSNGIGFLRLVTPAQP